MTPPVHRADPSTSPRPRRGSLPTKRTALMWLNVPLHATSEHSRSNRSFLNVHFAAVTVGREASTTTRPNSPTERVREQRADRSTGGGEIDSDRRRELQHKREKKWETDSAEITARYPNWKRRKEKIIKQAPLVSPLLDSPAGVTLLKFPLVSPNKLLTRKQFVKERDYGELQEACVLVCVFIRVCKCTAP